MSALIPRATMQAQALAHINRADEINAVRNAAIAALAKFDGKKVTKAFATAIEKMLPGYTTSYNVDGFGVFSTYRITVWGQGLKFDQRESFYLPVKCGLFDFNAFHDDMVNRQENAATYVRGLRETLPKYDELAARFLKAREEFEAAQAAFGALGHFALK